MDLERIGIPSNVLNEEDQKIVEGAIVGVVQSMSNTDVISDLTDSCWKACIKGKPTSANLDAAEEKCVSNCVRALDDVRVLVGKQFEDAIPRARAEFGRKIERFERENGGGSGKGNGSGDGKERG